MRAATWQLRTRRLTLDSTPRVMGIVNTTPDSFSDGGNFLDPARAIDHGLKLVDQGAAILDIGGESTRPGAEPVGADEELRRVMPVIEGLAHQCDIPLSIDTSKATVAREAIGAGAEIINDVTGLEGDVAMVGVAAATEVAVCVMHSQGPPSTMQNAPRYDNVVREVQAYLSDRRDALVQAGLVAERIAIDPGIGFGKTTDHNVALLQNLEGLHTLACPVLVGHSRKRFLGELIGDLKADRLGATIGVATALAAQGVQLVRVHDVGPVAEALRLHALLRP